ncbi:PREDICTED: HIV Tat-specific factor 1 [Papilio xuthus]|uniref:17S U2 SnRNP complex component HTATSF1 n=1 Tax=Papilio xuthus TaxID=66420 RepID=A0AAJ6ZDR7_PAPXU|nr:PREDICTED: HIV Tat-specific factor 1 [Papilio xuthus]
MSKPEKNVKSGFVIKLSCETVQKLSEQDKKEKSIEEAAETTTENENRMGIGQNERNKTENAAEFKGVNKSYVDEKTDGHEQESIPKVAEYITPNKTTKEKPAAAWGDYAPYVTYIGDKAVYTDPTSQQKYFWNQETNSWDPDTSGRVYSYENDTHVYTEPDGSKCFWDESKKAWLPNVDDEFLAYYLMSYGFVDNSKDETLKEKKDEEEKKVENKGVKRKNEPQWFEQSDEQNTKVYVSNLPLDLNEEEFVNFMQKCGLVERDPTTKKMKVKLYMDKEQNCFKGDALCTYIKIESVELALKLLDGSDLKGNKVKVERAHFQLKGEYNPALKPKKKKKKELEKIRKMQQNLFGWKPEKLLGQRSKHERVVIVKNLFHPKDFNEDVQLILDYQSDLREECAKCGDVRKVVIYDQHPEGVAQITMKEPEQADAVVQLINGRWFGKRQITAEIWDGWTKYKIAETDAEINTRLDKWDKFLEGKEGTSEAKSSSGESGDKSKLDKTTEEALDKKADKTESGLMTLVDKKDNTNEAKGKENAEENKVESSTESTVLEQPEESESGLVT